MRSHEPFITSLDSLVGTDQLIQIDRSPLDEFDMCGYVVAVNPEFLVLQEVRDFVLEGVSIICLFDLARYKRESRSRCEMTSHILRKNYDDFQMSFSLDPDAITFPQVLEGLHNTWPLVGIHREVISPDTLLIGRIIALKPRTLQLHNLDPDCQWSNTSRLRYDDITRVQLGGPYLEGLQRYREHLDLVEVNEV